MQRHTNPLCKPQQGASLLEVLIAILVFSLGLLGMAGLSAAAFSHNKTSQLRLTGVTLVNDYVERARLNLRGFDDGGYSITLTDSAPAASTLNADESNDATAATNVASMDRRAFLVDVATYLPAGEAVIITSGATGTLARNMDIWLLWKETAVTDAATDVLFQAGRQNCPNDLSSSDMLLYSCMYFRVAL